jgi:hypothetical protein
MENLCEQLNPGEQVDLSGQPTLNKTVKHSVALHCQACAHLYYVDDEAIVKAPVDLESTGSKIRFICHSCENQFAEAGHKLAMI